MVLENLNIEYNNACLVIKAINLKGNIKEAAKVLGRSETLVYEIIRRNHLKVLRGRENRMYISMKEKILYRDASGKCVSDLPI
jgi:hypothetical protein